jgi:uridine nucleosidase
LSAAADPRHIISFDDQTLACERYAVEVVTEGTYEEAMAGKTRTGQTVVTLLPPGQEGVRIPRSVDVPAFWKVLEECITRAEEAIQAKV